MKTSSAHPGILEFKRPALIATISAVMVCGASAEPPWRRAERPGTRTERPPMVAESWRDVQQHVQRDFTEARDNVRRDLGWVRENARREAERVRYEMEQRRARGFQFVDVLDAIFGRPSGPPRVDPGYYYEPEYQQEPIPPQVAETWERENEWADRFEEVQQSRTARQRQYEPEPRADQRLETAAERDRASARNSRPAMQPNQPQPEAQARKKAAANPVPRMRALDKPQQTVPDQRQSQGQVATREKKSSDQPSPPVVKKDSIPTNDDVADLAVEKKASSPKVNSPKPRTQAKDTYPYGLPVPGKDGMVYSPYVEESGKYVDVRNIPAGTLVKDPYSDKFFRVP